MKKLVLLLTIIFTVPSSAQQIDYELEWNDAMSRFDIYITRDANAAPPLLNSGVSRITVVFPTDAGRTLSPMSQNVDSYSQLPKITAPAAQPGSDFFTFTSNGGNSLIGVLNAGVRVLWVSFTASDGCGANGVRLYINGSDPDSGAAGMNGSDRTQGFSTLSVSGIVEEYNTNLGLPIDCSVLSTDDVELSGDFSVYPNPVKDELTIQFANNVSDADLSIYNMTGQLVYQEVPTIAQNKTRLNLSQISSGVYFLNVRTERGLVTKKILIE